MNLRAWIDRRAAADQRGFVVPAVIFALAIMAMIAMVALRTVDDEKRSARAVRESAGAFYAADGGLQKTLGTWPSTSVKALNSGDSLNLGWQTQANGSSYRAVIHRVDNGGTQMYAVVVYARGAGKLGGQAAVTTMIVGGAAGLFQRGVFSQGLLTMGGSGSLSDSYNSAVGPYNAATAGSNGDLFSNASISLNNGGTVVKGDATAVGTASGTSGVTGTVTQGASPIPPYSVLTCPSGGYTPLPTPLPSGVSYSGGDLKVGSSAGNYTLPSPPSTYHFHSISLSGGATLTLNNPSGQHMDIWLDDGLTIGGGGIGNTSGLPGMLGLWACGSPIKPTKWDLSGGSTGYFTVYAPNHDVVVGGGGDLFGAIIGGTVTASGGSHLHFDESLANQGGTQLTSLAGGWAEFPQ